MATIGISGSMDLYNYLKSKKIIRKIKQFLWKKLHLEDTNLGYWVRVIFLITPHLKIQKNKHKIIRLGSEYGGWHFVEDAELNQSKIISCGLGQDASFDIEFAKKYNAEVIIVDPTPEASDHFSKVADKILNQGNKRATQPYTSKSYQAIESYDVSELGAEQLKLEKIAIWKFDGFIKFFKPPTEIRMQGEISHSIINYLNGYATNGDSITVACKTLSTLMKEHNMRLPSLVKLDIEGAEIEVIENFLNARIIPKQILVEYDEYYHPSWRSCKRIYKTHLNLLRNRYKLINKNKTNFLYYLS